MVYIKFSNIANLRSKVKVLPLHHRPKGLLVLSQHERLELH